MHSHGCVSYIINRMKCKRSSLFGACSRPAKLKIVKVLTCLLIVLTFLLYHINIYEAFNRDGISCFQKVITDGIPDILDDIDFQPPKGKSIFFHETSCNTNTEGWIIQINSRQACAVESAANLNPNSTVYLLYTSPIRYPNVSMFSSHKYRILQELMKYKNVKIRRVDLKRYIKDTPLEDWFQTGQLNKSLYINSHTSDVLRYLSLWKYGGTYMDLDVVLMKSLGDLRPNYAGAESQKNVAAGVLNFDHENVGHHFAALCLRDLEQNFRGDNWGYNGPGVITRTLNQICHTKNVDAMTTERCNGFQVLPPSAFYPIYWMNWKLYFNPIKLKPVLKQLNKSYAIHVWNKFSYDTTIYKKNSDVAYGVIAKKYCPNVYKASGDIF